MLLPVWITWSQKNRNKLSYGNKEDKNKNLHAGYPVKFINDTWLFDETKLLVIRLPFAPFAPKFSKRFIRKLQTFTNGKVRFHIIWNTCKIQSKIQVEHLSCAFYKGVSSCCAEYIWEIICNVKIRWNEHERIELIGIQNVVNISKNIWTMVFIGQYYQ